MHVFAIANCPPDKYCALQHEQNVASLLICVDCTVSSNMGLVKCPSHTVLRVVLNFTVVYVARTT